MLMMIQTAWGSWADLFTWLPYGDPYLASGALFVLMITSAKLVAGGQPS